MKNKLKELRIGANLTLDHLSELSGISKSQLHDLEKQDGGCPRLYTAYAISRVLCEELNYIWPFNPSIDPK